MLQIVIARLDFGVSAIGIESWIARVESHHAGRRTAPVQCPLRPAQHLDSVDIVATAYAFIDAVHIHRRTRRRRDPTRSADTTVGSGRDTTDGDVIALYVSASDINGAIVDGAYSRDIL